MIYSTIAALIVIYLLKTATVIAVTGKNLPHAVMGILESSFTAVVVPCTATTDDSWSFAASLTPSDMPDGPGNADST